jgi:hypothetical protein
MHSFITHPVALLVGLGFVALAILLGALNYSTATANSVVAQARLQPTDAVTPPESDAVYKDATRRISAIQSETYIWGVALLVLLVVFVLYHAYTSKTA